MFCIRCGKKIADGARFCPFCGAETYQSGGGGRGPGKRLWIILVAVLCVSALLTLVVLDAVGVTDLFPFIGSSEIEAPAAVHDRDYIDEGDLPAYADELVSFEDSEFEAFVCEMFEKEPGTITRGDLNSINFFAYYEGAPTEISSLTNCGPCAGQYENTVLFCQADFPEGSDIFNLLHQEEFRLDCITVIVRSNGWMAEHVMPYLYYFENLEHVYFGYCWTENVNLPHGVHEWYENTHDKLAHEPYDPLYPGTEERHK